MMNSYTIVGLMAAACTTVAFLPQAVKIIKTRDTRSLSLPMYMIFTTGIFLWLIYGIMVWDIPIMAANVITLILSSIILLFIIRYRSQHIMS